MLSEELSTDMVCVVRESSLMARTGLLRCAGLTVTYTDLKLQDAILDVS